MDQDLAVSLVGNTMICASSLHTLPLHVAICNHVPIKTYLFT